MVIKISQIVVIASLSILLTNCITMQKSKASAKMASTSSEALVQSPGDEHPISEHWNEDVWLELRRQAKDDNIRKIYAALALSSWDVADKEAHAYLRKHPKDKDALLILATANTMARKFALANYYGQLHEEYFGESPEILNIRAIAIILDQNSSMSDLKNATGLLTRAFEVSNSEIASGLNLGQLYLEIGAHDRAAEVFAEVKSRCHNCRPARFGLGTAYMRGGKYAQAKDELKDVLKDNPNDVQTLYRLALVAKNGDSDDRQAKAYLNEIIAGKSANNLVKQRANVMLRRLDALETDKSLIAEKDQTFQPQSNDSQENADSMFTTFEESETEP